MGSSGSKKIRTFLHWIYSASELCISLGLNTTFVLLMSGSTKWDKSNKIYTTTYIYDY